jgi:G3E family GTPase
MDAKTHNPTPVIILAGFLGAGKTTLLNRILHHHAELRAAVLVNDFGALNIDAQFIRRVEENGTISLTNGCICCTIRDDLLAETARLLQRPSPPEYIIVEASGVSNPLTIIQTFMLPELSPLVRLDSVITVVDAERFDQLAGEYAALAFQQVAVADVVVINKTDLVNGEQLAALREKLRPFQPRIFETTHGQLPIELVIGTGVVDRLLLQREETVVEHHSMFSTWHWSCDHPLSGKAVRRALRHLPSGLLRAKGILYLQESSRERVILQVVGTRVSLTLGEVWGNSVPGSQIVAIGMPDSLDHTALTKHFENAVLTRQP